MVSAAADSGRAVNNSEAIANRTPEPAIRSSVTCSSNVFIKLNFLLPVIVFSAAFRGHTEFAAKIRSDSLEPDKPAARVLLSLGTEENPGNRCGKSSEILRKPTVWAAGGLAARPKTNLAPPIRTCQPVGRKLRRGFPENAGDPDCPCKRALADLPGSARGRSRLDIAFAVCAPCRQCLHPGLERQGNTRPSPGLTFP